MAVPHWALEEYPGAEQDFSEWLEQQFLTTNYSRELAIAVDQSTGEIVDKQVYEKTKALAKFETLQRTMSLKGLVSRAQVWQLYNANETGWFRLLPPEFDSIEELLAAMVDAAEEGTSEYYDLVFLVKQVLPMVRSSGLPPEELIGLSTKTSKARAAVPLLRSLIRTASAEDATEEEQEQMKQAVVAVVKEINSDIPVREFRNKMQELRGKNTKAPAQFICRRYILDGKEVFLFEVDEAQGRAMEIAMRGLICDIQVGDVATLLKDIQRIIGGI